MLEVLGGGLAMGILFVYGVAVIATKIRRGQIIALAMEIFVVYSAYTMFGGSTAGAFAAVFASAAFSIAYQFMPGVFSITPKDGIFGGRKEKDIEIPWED